MCSWLLGKTWTCSFTSIWSCHLAGSCPSSCNFKKGQNWAWKSYINGDPPDSTHLQNVVMQSFDNWCPLPGFCYECLVLLVEVHLLGFDSRHVVFQLTDLVDFSLPAVSGRNLLTSHTSQKIQINARLHVSKNGHLHEVWWQKNYPKESRILHLKSKSIKIAITLSPWI